MNVAVTGCAGYIGSILSKMLTERKYNVYGCDWSVNNSIDFIKSYSNVSFDDDAYIENIIKNKVKVIFHLAATSLVGPSFTNPLEYYDNNTGRTAVFLNKLISAGWFGHIVFASTAAVYGGYPRNGNSFNEYSETAPLNHYGQSKLFCEHIINSAQVNEITCTSFRFFNVVGSYKGLGEEYDDTHLFSKLCFSAINDQPFYLYGTDYPTGDGTCIRDYVHVVDVCEAQILAATKLNTVSNVYNLGTSKGTSVYQIINAFKEYTGKNVNVVLSEKRKGDPPSLIADPRKFICYADFKYNHSTLREMIMSTWDYYNERGFHGV